MGPGLIVVTAGTKEYRDIIQAQIRACRNFGYCHFAYDLGGLGFGNKYDVDPADLAPSFGSDSLPPATFKPLLVADAFGAAEPGETVCWLDGDCLPLQPFEPEYADAAVTLRPTKEIGQCGHRSMDFVNSGVVWIRNTTHGREFAVEWSKASFMLNTDQDGLNQAVAPRFQAHQWIRCIGTEITSPCGARVQVLDGMNWNRWHLPPAKDTRILHFKRGIRGAAKNYL